MNFLRITMTLIAVSFLATACNTIEGFGEDVQKGGKNIEKTAESNK